MKKLFLIAALSTVLFSCRKDEDVKPSDEFDASEWANLGNDIFNDGGFPFPDSIAGSDSTVTPVSLIK